MQQSGAGLHPERATLPMVASPGLGPKVSRQLQRWTYEDSCASFLLSLGDANDAASDAVQKAISALSISPSPPWVDGALHNSFGIKSTNINKPDLVAAILATYGKLSSHFSAGDCDYECNCTDCPHPGTDLGCTSPGEGPVIVCIGNLQPSDLGVPTGNMKDIIVHEFSHRFGGTSDFSYCEPSCRDLPSDQGIGNAESYAEFAAEAFRHTTPPPGPTPPGPTPPGPTTYTVVAGDFLYKIAANLCGDASKWKEIYAANVGVIGADPDLIFPGQVLTIPCFISTSP